MTPPPEWEQRLLAGCDAAQRAAITAPAAPLLVVAGAGSGKTRVLTRRIAWRVHEGSATAGHVLALTFTRKAATELRDRLSGLGLPAPVTAGTFHAIALAELRRRRAEQGRLTPVLLESKARLIAAALGDHAAGRARTGGPAPERRSLLAACAAEIEWSKARLIAPGDYPAAAGPAGRRPPVPAEEMAAIYARYESERRRRRVYDFDDLLAALAEEIERDPEFAAAQRWRFAHLFVDELQDANPAQLRLLEAWRGGRPDLFAVGDPRQAIYGWNGADPLAVLRFAERFAGATVLSLDTNYRSSPQVVAMASAVLERADAAGPPRSARADGAVPTLRVYPDEDAEATGVAAALRRAHRPGRPWSHCAVLARTNGQLGLIEEVLRASGIPVRSSAGSGLLARPAVRAALAALDPRAGNRGLRAFLEGLAATLEADEALPFLGEGDDEDEVRDDLGVLARLGVEQLQIDPLAGADGFLAFVRDAWRDGPATGRDAVELTTFHRAKGLEWPVVFLVGLEDGFVPSARATTPAALDEERRLLYVALSRAEDELHCSYATSRRFSGRLVARQASPFLARLEATRRSLADTARPVGDGARAHLAASRAALRQATRRG